MKMAAYWTLLVLLAVSTVHVTGEPVTFSLPGELLRVQENAGFISVCVTKTGPTEQTFRGVRIFTSDILAGTAGDFYLIIIIIIIIIITSLLMCHLLYNYYNFTTGFLDYIPTDIVLTFAPDDIVVQCISITILADEIVEQTENFAVNIALDSQDIDATVNHSVVIVEIIDSNFVGEIHESLLSIFEALACRVLFNVLSHLSLPRL